MNLRVALSTATRHIYVERTSILRQHSSTTHYAHNQGLLLPRRVAVPNSEIPDLPEPELRVEADDTLVSE